MGNISHKSSVCGQACLVVCVGFFFPFVGGNALNWKRIGWTKLIRKKGMSSWSENHSESRKDAGREGGMDQTALLFLWPRERGVTLGESGEGKSCWRSGLRLLVGGLKCAQEEYVGVCAHTRGCLMLGKVEGRETGWDGWMASPTQWTWVWANSGRWWWMGRPGVLQSMGLQRVRHDWASEQRQ